MDSDKEDSTIPILFKYGNHAVKKMMPKGISSTELEDACEELFPELHAGPGGRTYFLQLLDEEFNENVDLGDRCICKKSVIHIIDKASPSTSKRGAAASSSSGDERGKGLLHTIQSIRKKLKSKSGPSQPRQASKIGRKEKAELAFQLGWLHYNPKRREYVQVRAIRGGGSPTLRMKCDATAEELITLGKNTFFPNGMSKMGDMKNMEVQLADFRAQEVPGDWSLEQAAQPGVKIRLYLLTKRKDDPSSDSDESSDLPDPELSVHDGQDTFAEHMGSAHASTYDNQGTLASAVLHASTSQKQLASAHSSEFGTQDGIVDLSFSQDLQLSALETQTDIASTSTAGPSTPFHPAGTPTVLFKQESQGLCGICCDRKKDSFFVPCGHTLCLPCSAFLEENEGRDCPFCKQKIQSVRSLYY